MTFNTVDGKQLEARPHLARLTDSCPDALVFTDKDGNVALFSERAEALLG
jgi:hypothetical protein